MLTTVLARFTDYLGQRSVERTWTDHVACAALCKATAQLRKVCRNALLRVCISFQALPQC